MYTTTELFGRIHTSKKPLAAARRDLRHRPRFHLEALCERKFPSGWDALNSSHANSRGRLYTPRTTCLTFLSQVLSPGSSCREAVRQAQAACDLLPGGPTVRSDTSPYCQARARLEPERLTRLRRHLAGQMEANVPHGSLPWPRAIKVVDGSCLNMPDTPGNRELYPQAPGQLPGCGFPIMRIIGVFSLQTGACLDYLHAPYLTSEGALFRQLWHGFKSGDVVLADRLFDSYGNIAGLQQQGVDSIFHLHANRPDDFRRGQVLGSLDRLYTLTRPTHPAAGWTREDWTALPKTMTVRQIKIKIRNPNIRSKSVTVITTLLDPVLWPKHLIQRIYQQRWNVELYLDDIKTTLQMDMLSCRSPAMVHKELEMHMIAYNLTRSCMQEAALTCLVPLPRISFKGTIDTMRQYSHTLASIPRNQRHKRRMLYDRMLHAIACDPLPHRPGRREPRCLKRRPKAYPFMTKPRRQMKDVLKSSRRHPKIPSP